MAKKRTGGAKRYAGKGQRGGGGGGSAGANAAAAAAADNERAANPSAAAPVSGRVAKKVVRKVHFLERVAASSAAAAALRQKRGGPGGGGGRGGLLGPGAGVAKRRGARRHGRKGGAGAGTLPDLSALAGSLEDILGQQQQQKQQQQQQQQQQGSGAASAGALTGAARKGVGSSVKRAGARESLVSAESARMAAVLAHPAYREDPLAAIARHLEATAPPPLPLPAAPGNKQHGGSAAGKRKKGKKSKNGDSMMMGD